MAWCQFSVKSVLKALLWEDLFLTFVSPFLSAQLRNRTVSALPSAQHVWSRGAANGGGHFDSRKMLESAIHALTIQVKCPQCKNSLNTNGKLLIYIHLTKLLTWLYPVCPSKPIN